MGVQTRHVPVLLFGALSVVAVVTILVAATSLPPPPRSRVLYATAAIYGIGTLGLGLAIWQFRN